MKNYLFIIVIFILSHIITFGLKAQTAGSLDTDFGNGGVVVVDVVSNEVDMSEDTWVYPDGKILMVGKSRDANSKYNVSLVRLLANGSKDLSFGNQGVVITSASTESDYGLSLYVQDDNKIVVAGYAMNSQYDMMVIRYLDNGSLDESFGVGGISMLPINNKTSIAEAVSIQTDGKILIGGYAYSMGDRFCIQRLNTDGTLDTTFGNNGYTFYEPISPAYIKSIDIQSDGKIIAAGIGYLDNLPSFMVVRFNSDGSVDNNFGTSGIVIKHIGAGNDFANKVRILNDGHILVGGHSWKANIPVLQYDLALLMLDSLGNTDANFGNNGIVITHITDEENYLFDIRVMNNNKIIATGYATNSTSTKMIATRYNSDGSLDLSFGGNNTGYNIVNISNNLYATALGIQPNSGKIILGGYGTFSDSFNFYAVRLHGDEVVHVTGVSLNESTKTIMIDDEFTLIANVQPDNATNKIVSWSSSDNTTVSVDNNGKIKGIKKGVATITVTTADGNHTATCTVTVEQIDGTKEINNQDICVYPNPADGVFTINTKKTYSLQVIDIMGKTIDNKEVLGNSTISLQSGVYFLKFYRENEKTHIQKIIIK